jgi:dihydrofolate reductase
LRILCFLTARRYNPLRNTRLISHPEPHKRQLRRSAIKLSVFCGVSVDGFLARPDDGLDFLRAGEKEPHGFDEFLASVDVVVLGRRTLDVVRGLAHLPLYGEKPVIVLSSRPLDFSPVKSDNVERMSGEPAEIVEQLKSRGFKHAYIDGGITIQRFLAAGLIDRLVITRVPVLIGAGISLFGPLPNDIILRHVATRSYDAGMVQSEYTVAAKESP